MQKALFVLFSVFVMVIITLSQANAGISFVTNPALYEDNSTLSTDPDNATVLQYFDGDLVLWEYATDNSCTVDPDITIQWCVKGEDNQTECYDAFRWTVWAFCAPADSLDRGAYTFWAEMTDCEGTVSSGFYYIFVEWPPVISTAYRDLQSEFMGRVARQYRTAFNHGGYPNAILDSPELWGADNPSMFYGDGLMYHIFGDPNVYEARDVRKARNGAIAFTDTIIPEKGIDLAHQRSWATDNATGVAKSIIECGDNCSRTNNTGGAVIPGTGNGKQIWFGYYDYKGDPTGKYKSYRYYVRLGFAYSDDNFDTTATRPESLVFWDRHDPGNGDILPDPYLGYSMRLHKEHLYAMVPRMGAKPVLLRCRIDELNNASLANWHYLVSTADNGTAVWSVQGIARGQISDETMPTVDFDVNPGIVNSVIWNPYMNRWVALNTGSGICIWESKYIWGPFKKLQDPGNIVVRNFSGYNMFSHELLLGNNGEWLYYNRSGPWGENIAIARYGVFHYRFHMDPKIDIELSQKCAVADNTVTITCTNTSGLPSPDTDNVTVTVDKNPANFISRQGDVYTYSYTLTGDENSGQVGAVEVTAVMDIDKDNHTTYHTTRDVALIVNHINNVTCRITSPGDNATVSGWVELDAEAVYDIGPEVLGAGQAEVQIIKTELRHVDGGQEVVEDTDVQAPYQLIVDTRRYANGPQTFKVIAYDTLDRRGEAEITLKVDNLPQPAMTGNLVVDGNMEAAGTGAWTSYNGGILSKTADERHRSGQQSLLLLNNTPASASGVQQTISGLNGGESLRLTAWTRMKSNYAGYLTWRILDMSNQTIVGESCASYAYFRRFIHEFVNPANNTSLTIRYYIYDTSGIPQVAGEELTSIEAIVDDVVLRTSDYPAVESPAGVRVLAVPGSDNATVWWCPSADVNLEYHYVYRKLTTESADAYVKIKEAKKHRMFVTDDQLSGSPFDYDYRVVAVDSMADESLAIDMDVQDATLHISGQINGDIQAGITVKVYKVSCGGEELITSTVTDANGYYVFNNLAQAIYTVKPEEAGYSFEPVEHLIQIPRDAYVPSNFRSTAAP